MINAVEVKEIIDTSYKKLYFNYKFKTMDLNFKNLDILWTLGILYPLDRILIVYVKHFKGMKNQCFTKTVLSISFSIINGYFYAKSVNIKKNMSGKNCILLKILVG